MTFGPVWLMIGPDVTLVDLREIFEQGFFLYADAKTQITGNSKTQIIFQNSDIFSPKLRSENGKTQILRHFYCVSKEMIL